MFKKAVLGLLCLCSPVFAGELTNFGSIIQELDVGREIRVVIHDSLCKMNDPNEYKIPASTMVVKPSALLFTDNLISFDATKFAGSRLPYATNGLLQRGVFALYSNGQVNITIAFFDAETNKKSTHWNDVKIECQLGDGVKVYQG